MSQRILLLPGDGIGPEVIREAEKVLVQVISRFKLDLQLETALLGGAAIDSEGTPLPDSTLTLANEADAILLGAVGGPKWDQIDRSIRPEKGLLGLRSGLQLFGNLRPAITFPQLADASSLKKELVAGLDLLIVRELTGGIYFGEPRGIRELENGEKQGFNTYVYSESEIERIGRVAFDAARKRDGRLCSVDKANVLEVTVLWREVMDRLSHEYKDVELSHMYVDNAAMQLIREPKQFDVMVTGNMFGDILSDAAAMLTGSIGMLPSASLDINGKGMYEPCHGSAPDIAGQNKANPLAAILSCAMMMRYSLGLEQVALTIERAVEKTLDDGYRTIDIFTDGYKKVSTSEMGDAVTDILSSI